MNVYTVTYYRGNYGSALQAYALQTKMLECGVNAKIIEPPIAESQIKASLIDRIRAFLKPEKHYGIKGKIRRIVEAKLFKEKNVKINSFVKENIQTISYDNFCSQLKDDDILVSGSDQIWSLIDGNIKGFYLFKEVKNEKVFRASYAASIGISGLSDDQIEYYKNALLDFDIVSLREKAAFDQLNFELKNSVVRQDVDPTLLYDNTFWKELVGNRIIKENYIFVYMLRPDNRLISMAKELAKKKHKKIIYIGQFNNFYLGVKTISNAGVEDFLSAIYYADEIITNSFHGTVFSILFEKKFASVRIESTSSRVENLLNILNLEKHLISDEKDLSIIHENVDYISVKEKLISHRNNSLEYIAKEICKDKQYIVQKEEMEC